MSSRFVQTASAPFTAASRHIGTAKEQVANLVRLEVLVAVVCALIPFVLLSGNGWMLKESISHYHDMLKPQYFYVPLTGAGMLFIINGARVGQHWYNVALGLALLALTFFNRRDHHDLHIASAAAFFLGNALVVVVFTPRRELWFKAIMALLIIGALLGYFAFHWYSLFWAESLSLWVIAYHFVLEALGLIK